MRIFKELGHGFFGVFRSLGYTQKHGLWGLYALPALVSLGIFALVGWGFYAFSAEIYLWLETKVGLAEGESWWQKTAQFFIGLVIYGITLILYLKIYKYLVLILVSPFLGPVAERVIQIEKPESLTEVPFSFARFSADLKRSLQISLRNLGIELGIVGSLALLSFFVPVTSPFITPVVLLVEWYFIGFGFMDPRNEIRQVSVTNTKDFVWRHKGAAVGNGAAFFLLLFIPFLGVLLAPVWATISATRQAENFVEEVANSQQENL
jgi:CysZ protein